MNSITAGPTHHLPRNTHQAALLPQLHHTPLLLDTEKAVVLAVPALPHPTLLVVPVVQHLTPAVVLVVAQVLLHLTLAVVLVLVAVPLHHTQPDLPTIEADVHQKRMP